MGAKYWLYGDEFDKLRGAIDRGEPVQTEIMDQDEKVWKQARIMVLQQQAEGTEPGGLLGRFGEPFNEGKMFIRVLEELASPLDED